MPVALDDDALMGAVKGRAFEFQEDEVFSGDGVGELRVGEGDGGGGMIFEVGFKARANVVIETDEAALLLHVGRGEELAGDAGGGADGFIVVEGCRHRLVIPPVKASGDEEGGGEHHDEEGDGGSG